MVTSKDLRTLHKLARQIEEHGKELQLLVEQEIQLPKPRFMDYYQKKLNHLNDEISLANTMYMYYSKLHDIED